MAALSLFLLWLQGAQALPNPFVSWFGDKSKPGRFLLKKTSFTASDFKFHVDFLDPPSNVRKSWEFIGEVGGSLSHHFEQDMIFRSYLSMAQNLTLGEKERIVLGIPKEAKYFTFSYPVSELKGAFTLEDDGKNRQGKSTMQPDADIAFFSIGGFMYFNQEKNLVAAMALAQDSKKGRMKFEKELAWKPKWSEIMPGDWFHHTTFPTLTNKGLKFFMWVSPAQTFLRNEDIESIERSQKGVWQKLVSFFRRSKSLEQPECPHGCFAYLGHHPKAKVSEMVTKLDVYYPLELDLTRQEL